MTDKDSLPAISALFFSIATLGLVRARALARMHMNNAHAQEANEREENSAPQTEIANDAVEEREATKEEELVLSPPIQPVIATEVVTPSLWQTASNNVYNLVTWPWRKTVETYQHIKESVMLARDQYVRLRNAAQKVVDAATKLYDALDEFNIVAAEAQQSLPPVEKVSRGFKFFSALLTVLFFRNTIATAAKAAVTTVGAVTAMAMRNPRATTIAATMVAPPAAMLYSVESRRMKNAEQTILGSVTDNVINTCSGVFNSARRLVY